MPRFPHYKQLDAMDCGPTCLRMIAKYFGKTYSLQTLRDKSYISREGVSLMGISDAAESIGLHTMGVQTDFETLYKEAPLPLVAHWRQNHFVVVYNIKKKGNDYIVYVADPALGKIKYTKKEFVQNWASSVNEEGQKEGICLITETTPDFYQHEDEKINKSGFKFLFSYLKPYKSFVTQMIIGLLIGSIIQLIFPFLTQSIVDYGINNQDIDFIYLVLIAQLALFIGRSSVNVIRSWILLHLGTRINISLISDFLRKIMRLPIAFFDTKMIGDLLQRINDHQRIENFLTSTTLNILFSLISLIVFGIVLVIYEVKIFLIFFVGSIIYVIWVYFFMKKRRELDHKRFAQLSDNQSNIIELITGMQEIKLNNCEREKRWKWERIQARLFRVNVKSLSIDQYQQTGGFFINDLTNIFITFISATAVIKGQMTLGMMLAVQYIIGQLNAPLRQLIQLLHTMQDAKISLERLGEIHQKDDEEESEEDKIPELPEKRSYKISNLAFQYEGPHSEFVLKDINLDIPEKKVTAIVGASGSGKTTLVKLMLGFYPPTNGEIKLGGVNLSNFRQKMLRQKFGVVMQDGFIFSDTIANNIAISDQNVDKTKLLHAVKVANIQSFIESLPSNYNTKIGANGHGLSQGQKQRILIARAVYKDPEYLFFDEATSALDANTEKQIMNNLEGFYKGRTVVVVAHRLSTVKNADQIVVLQYGKIAETGTHTELTEKRGIYYSLVKNQLELGN